MAQKTVVTLVSDLTNEEISEGEGETVEFGLDGVTYETDLFLDQAEELREALAPYMANARRVGGRAKRGRGRQAPGGGGAKSQDRQRNQDIRDWARGQGIEIADRGRIPGEIAAKYDAAH